MRWKTMVTGLALALASAVGCKQQCFLAECDYDHYVKDLALPANLPCDPSVSITPSMSGIAAPATVRSTSFQRVLRFPKAIGSKASVARPEKTTGTHSAGRPNPFS